nr:adenylate/guanylate cyclase domain-containing protein [Enterovirga rhinocerotis]
MKRKIAAILAADVAGYSRLVAEDEERTLTELAAARDIFDALVARVGGRIFNTAGDSIMVEFDSAVEAVRAAVDIQEAMKTRNLDLEPKRRLEFRMGLTIGDVVERDGDLLGDGVNIAARLESLAPPGGICVSRSVHEAVANKLSVGFKELGPRQVKNIPQPVHAYLVGSPGEMMVAAEPLVARRDGSVARPDRREPGLRRFLRRIVMLAAILGMVYFALPALQLAHTILDPYLHPPAQQAPDGEAGTPKPQATAPPGESAQPEKPPQPEKPAQTEKPAQPERPARPRAERPPAKPPAPKPEPARPETARPDRTGDPATVYAGLAREGLIADARSLPEFYHNARFLEAKGDRTGALAAYAAAAPLAGEAIDVHFRYASLLRMVRGPAAVRQAYAALIRTNPSVAAELMMAFGSETDDRRERLEAFVASHPGVAAADNLMADALLDQRDGGPTLTERRLAFDATERFLDAAASGDLSSRFVDRTFLDGWLDMARRRRGEIERFFSSARTRPTAAFSRSSTGWLTRLSLPEPASAIAVRIGEQGPFTSTGSSATLDSRTGKPMPNVEFELPPGTGRVTLYVTYQDRSGREAGPFPLSFDPGAATVESGRAALERFPESWVSFREDLPGVLSFAGLISNRCALSRVMIGFGDEPPRSQLPLPACDPSGSAALPSNASLVSLPNGTEVVQIQLVYADGSESAVRTFKRP